MNVLTLNPQVKELLKKLGDSNSVALENLSPTEVREAFAYSRSQIKEIIKPVSKVEDLSIDSPGGAISIRIYTPGGQGAFPILVFFHGGGFVLGNLETTDNICRYFANGAECIVVSVDYRLAPEHKFPSAVEDAYFATKWVEDNALSFNGDPARIAVGGESAGGNLAAVVSIISREKRTPSIQFQLLIYPSTHLAHNTESCIECGNKYNLTLDEMEWFGNHYLSDEKQIENPLVSPLVTEDLSNLPPALVITAEFDPLRDEGEEYAERLASSGVDARKKRYSGMVHSFFNYSGEVDQSKVALDETVSELRQVFHSQLTEF